ncbi:zinc finger protein 395 [Halyomorpha halys]|uniref:zinc finger protein 395 n=1 Tax=Halyomorpha halys TaxID=286706 RepID=UPI0006D4E412
MSTGKRLAKRSIIGTRVCVRGDDGIYYSGVINAVKSCTNDSRYSVRFDPTPKAPAPKREYRDVELIGPGFQTMQGIRLLKGQRVYITYNGRETSGEVLQHSKDEDEVVISVNPPGAEAGIEVRKRLEDVRLTECRKSARLQDQDTDYSRLADMAGDRRRLSSSIDVPPTYGSRKRRPSTSQDDQKEDLMDECTAALVLMHLSCSPHSPPGWMEPLSPAPSDACSWRSGTPSPPLSESAPSAWLSASDEGIELDDDFDEFPKKKKVKTSRHWNQLSDNRECIDITAFRDVNGEATRTVYQCTWPGCHVRTTTCNSIEAHVRNTHLGRNEGEDEGMAGDDHEEEFYYTELEVGLASPLPTLSHRDMARPAHEDPEYQKGCAMPIPSNSWPAAISPSCSQKQIKLSVSAPSSARVPSSPSRRLRGDTKKCRKVYGMEHRDLWCTQCKWKKACTRFGD